MKKLLLFIVILCFTFPIITKGQVGVINTIAGVGTAGYSGDAGPATAAQLNSPWGIAVDLHNNIYIAEWHGNRVRKISASGIITTIAGNGSAGFSGDGGPATAAKLDGPSGVTVDYSGNIYIADHYNFRFRKVSTSGIITTIAGNGGTSYLGDGRAATATGLNGVVAAAIDNYGNIFITGGDVVRKINPSGIISTVAGNSTAGYSGDGGPATAAMINSVYDLTIDKWGNLYLADQQNHRVRKVDTNGVIITVAGTGAYGYSGDGGPATAAKFNTSYGVAVDTNLNLFIADLLNKRIRKIDTGGIVTTIVGSGSLGDGGDGGPATLAMLNSARSVKIDNAGNIIISDGNNNRIRKVQPTYPMVSDSFSVFLTNYCGGIKFNVVTNFYTSGQHIKTYFNNGALLDTATISYSSNGIVSFSRPYMLSGIYTIKHVLYQGTSAIDSITYSREYRQCQDIGIDFYYDGNGNCVKDGYEKPTYLPITAEIDSNGIPVDTISGTSGFNYTALGSPTDVYTFNIISRPVGLYVTCPSSGVIRDTLSKWSGKKKNIGFSCTSTTSAFDLGVYMSSIAGRHKQSIDVVVNNAFCTPQSTTFSLHFSSHYNFESANPAPTSVTGTTATWNLDTISSYMPTPKHIHTTLAVPGAWLTIGDTVHTNSIVLPTGGDYDTANNVIVKNDTVKGSWDPNEVSVSPSGYILAGAQLRYTINFENTGNDTAFNIYVMDTLPDNVDPASMRVVAASAEMNTTKYYDGTIHHNIIKFEFPKINLLDSSHHDQCDGFVIFDIKSKANLPDSTSILNHAGIFFDDNPVVITNTAQNIVANIHGVGTLCQSTIDILTEFVTGGFWSASNSHATISPAGIITGISAGIDTIKYVVIYANGTIATQKIITINPLPVRGVISGVDSLCASATTSLTETVTGGTWHSANSHATVTTSGVVTGASAGIDTIIYRVVNSCGVDSAIKRIIVKPLPISGSISGSDSVCVGATISLTETSSSGTWHSINSHATVSGAGVVSGISAGVDTIVYIVSNFCGTASANKRIIINPVPYAGSISGVDSLCTGATTTLTATTGGAWFSVNSHATITSGGLITGVSVGIDTIIYRVANSCGTDSAIKRIIVEPLPNAGSLTGADSVCPGATISLTTTSSGGSWHSTNSHASVTSGGIVSGLSFGADTIVYRVTNFCGTDTAFKRVFVNFTPNAGGITGADSVCQGDATTLSDTITSGIWSSSNSLATVAGGIVSGVATGVDTIYYIVANSCGSDTAFHSIIVKPIPYAGIISGIDSLCTGTSVTLTSSISGGNWNATNSMAGVSGGLVSGYNVGLDTIQYTYTNSCGTDTARFTVNISTVPATPNILGNGYVCVGRQPDTLIGIPLGGNWSRTNLNASVTGGIVTAVTVGTDTIIYSVANFCGSNFTTFVVTIPSIQDCDSINSVRQLANDEEVRVYPNPAINELTIDANPEIYSSCLIIDVLGREVLWQVLGNRKTNVNMSNLQSGVFYLKIIGTNGTFVEKIVKL